MEEKKKILEIIQEWSGKNITRQNLDNIFFALAMDGELEKLFNTEVQKRKKVLRLESEEIHGD